MTTTSPRERSRPSRRTKHIDKLLDHEVVQLSEYVRAKGPFWRGKLATCVEFSGPDDVRSELRAEGFTPAIERIVKRHGITFITRLLSADIHKAARLVQLAKS